MIMPILRASRIPFDFRRVWLCMLLALPALPACERPGTPPTIQWMEASGDPAAAPVVGGDIPVYQPPPYIDLAALEIAMQSSEFPTSLDFLLGTIWKGEDVPPGEPAGLYFLSNMLTISQRDGRNTTVVADYSARHIRCHGYPLCVVTLNTNGALSVNFLHLRGDELRFAECMDFSPNPVPTDEQLAQTRAVRVWRKDSVLCFVYDNNGYYRPDFEAEGLDQRPDNTAPLVPSGPVILSQPQ